MAELGQLREYILQTLNPDATIRKNAETFLSSVEYQPGFSLLLLQLIEAHCASESAQDKAIRQATAVLFKNAVKRCWNPEEGRSSFSENDKSQIKGLMVNYMCSTPPDVQRQLSEALAIMSASDFPAKWENLLPELVSKFTLENFHVTNGVLITANSILKRFRNAYKSDALFLELKHCLGFLQEPLTQLFQAIAQKVVELSAQPGGAPEVYRQLMPMMQALRTICRIFYSLNWQDLPEYFEDNMSKWMEIFLHFLSYENATLNDPDEEDEPGPIEKLQAAIVENVSLYAEKYEEEFSAWISKFTPAISSLLTKLQIQTKFDPLATTALRFLTTVISKAHYKALFDGTLPSLVEHIVIPNLMLRESDEELFEDNPGEWIQRDMEGSDSESRRRCTCELVKGMGKQFEAEVTQLCGQFIMQMLQQYSADPENQWKGKDAAILLLVSVTTKKQTSARGVSETNAAIPLMDLAVNHIFPELQNPDVNARPIVRSDAIKFIATFRNQLSKDHLVNLMPMIVGHLKSESIVVQSYAAHCIERILTVKDPSPTGGPPVPRFGRPNLQPLLGSLFDGLFVILSRTDDSFENEYVMKAIMRALTVADEDVVPHSESLLNTFNQALEKVCKNPRNPHFNHYLFESTAVLVSSACKINPALTTQFEQLLFPPFQTVLAMDVAEFSPYVFQILAQLLEFRPDGLSDAYRALFAPLLAPANWDRKANCPALARLLRAYLRQGAAEISGHLEAMLGVFQKLLALRTTETESFSLLEAIITYLPLTTIQPYLPTILQLIVTRLQQNQTAKFSKHFLHFVSLFAAKHGAVAIVQGLEAIQGGMTCMLVNMVWSKAVENSPPEHFEAKVCSIGITKLLTEADPVKTNPEAALNLMNSLVTILEPSSSTGKEEDDIYVEERIGFDGDSFSKLHFSGHTETDPLPEIADYKSESLTVLARFSQANPGYLSSVLGAMAPEKAQVLGRMTTQLGVTFQ